MSKTTFVKLDTVARKDCFLQTTLRDDGKEGFQLMVTDGENIWSGDLTEDNIDSLSSKAKMDYNTYVAQTVKAFTQQNMAGMHFEFQMKTRGDDSVDFIWKKYVPADEIKFQLGSVTLYMKDDPARCIRQIFQQNITTNTSLQERIRSLDTDNERLSRERAMALKRLDKCITAKEEVERDLYEKFVAVLNSKKEKIRALKQQIEEGVPSTSSVKDGARPGTSGVGDAGVSDESENEDVANSISSTSRVPRGSVDEEENTDEESQPAPSKRRRRAPVGQTTKKEADSSLVLEDEPDRAVTTVARRPARQRGANKKQTPSKPVLPKVTSKRSDSGGSSGPDRRSSMRKSSSHSSNRSSDHQDPDDLFADLE
ncbi:DNA repair protein XRCC4-like isoform X1 [Haliotis cracherodii]|uniref:DNA repair protein XRCC4-like isoform X1 n=1 Tax=Haliotis cracherodii TaxID=6455 RepID=UPI0039E72CF4